MLGAAGARSAFAEKAACANSSCEVTRTEAESKKMLSPDQYASLAPVDDTQGLVLHDLDGGMKPPAFAP